MKITRENYETWFLDYLEGNLAPGDKEELLSFLSLNSDLAAQLDGEIPTFHPDLTITIDKGPLQKSAFDDKNIFDTTAIALAEGDLSPDEKVTFEKWIAMHPAKKIEVQLFAGTKLISDPNIRFQWKDSLKKTYSHCAVMGQSGFGSRCRCNGHSALPPGSKAGCSC
jgi:hypothetical protein